MLALTSPIGLFLAVALALAVGTITPIPAPIVSFVTTYPVIAGLYAAAPF